MAHQLAKELKMHTIRVDMSELNDSHSSSKLLGPPPGFVGHEKGTVGFLDDVVNKPHAVVIFDEIGKVPSKRTKYPSANHGLWFCN